MFPRPDCAVSNLTVNFKNRIEHASLFGRRVVWVCVHACAHMYAPYACLPVGVTQIPFFLSLSPRSSAPIMRDGC